MSSEVKLNPAAPGTDSIVVDRNSLEQIRGRIEAGDVAWAIEQLCSLTVISNLAKRVDSRTIQLKPTLISEWVGPDTPANPQLQPWQSC